MYRVFLGLGSNLGDRLQYLSDAIGEISVVSDMKAVSTVYRSEPYGMTSRNEFLNVAAEVATQSEPHDLLERLKEIERKLGRSVHTHMRDREIDIDILLYDNFYYEEHSDQSIVVPHPDLPNRKFVLMSLDEIAPAVLHPLYGESIHVLLHRCPDHRAVEPTGLRLVDSLLKSNARASIT